MINWQKSKEYVDCWYTSEMFNGYTYNVIISVEKSDKSIKFFVAASSGKKRKEFSVFEEKQTKSLGGIKALFWLKRAVFDFPTFYLPQDKRNKYLCIGWSDTRRREIYKKYLIKEGFVEMQDEGSRILIKKL